MDRARLARQVWESRWRGGKQRTAAQAASRLDGARAQIGERDVELLRLKAQISDAEEELGEWRLGNLRVSNWAVWTKAFDERRGR